MGVFRRAEAGLVIIVILLIAFIFIGWLISLGQRECKSNRDCSSDSYCGSDFACHEHPSIQKTVVKYSLIGPSLIVGIAIIIAAIILRWKRLNSKES